ncbi:MAG: Gfo/Idh/MocA family oxidoreductase [Caldilineaceae bacterium]|nr:Gfo/Idh/MocA family oxidoreductase [Caldilineaceae bacterium]
MQEVHAALLGLSHPHSLAHLRTLQAVTEVASIVLWDPDETLLKSTQENQGEKVSATTTDLGSVLSEEEILFVVAALRNDLGPPIFTRALEAGKHVITDKPVGKTAVESAEVAAVAKREGCKLGVFYQNRALPPIQDARRIVEQGLIGELVSVEMRMVTTQVQVRDPSHWLFNMDKAGGGILSWLGCHYIDQILNITQDEIVSVAAQIATRSGEDIDVEDVAALSLGFASGAVGTFHAGYMLAMSGGGYHNAAGYDTYVSVNGRLGRITYSSNGTPSSIYVESAHPSWSSAPRRTFDYTFGDSPAYGGGAGETFLRAFIDACQGKGEPLTTGEDAVRVAKVVDAAYESSRSGRRIHI